MTSRERNALRKDDPSGWQVEDDYLSTRGYPMTERNRQVVRTMLGSMPGGADRKAVFRFLDARLLNRGGTAA